MKDLVSVIVPAYQEEKRIGRCLQSILASTYQRLQVIVVNDGSTDDTAKIVSSFKRNRESESVSIELVNICNGGSGRARNHGLRRAKGEYISFVDADDMIHPQMIERLVLSLQNGSDMASCSLVFCNESGRGRRYQHHRRQRVVCPVQALKMAMWDQIQMTLGPVLFRKEKVFAEEGKLSVFCPEDVAGFEDFAFVCEYLKQCNDIWEVLPFHGYFYCRRKGSQTYREWSAEELSHALQPVLAVGMGMHDENFISHKLQYTFRFMAFWYERACRCSRHTFTPDCIDWKVCMRELNRFADVYMKSSDVAWYRKLAVRIVRRHTKTGWLLAKTIGRIVF